MIEEAESLLLRASARNAIGRYQIEGALQSAHVHRRRTGESNWAAVVQLYDALQMISRFAGRRDQSGAGLGTGAGCASCAFRAGHRVEGFAMVEYQPYWAARAELLANTGAHSQAKRRVRHRHRARAGRGGSSFPAATAGRVGYSFCRFLTRSSTTAGSANVVVSPRFSSSFAAILRRMRRMILPERVFGNPGAH